MPLSTGTKLGSYEITGGIGAGGMGEVYQAHDTKLGRDVAIKILPEAFAHDPERLSRFQREAKMLAALNHPNIATIYGLEQSNGTSYLVMELVAGETLADRIKREGAMPVEEALAICKQIAEALEAAHEKGIIHRDLKPANVKLTPEGKVKVLDFGLAKAFAGDVADSDPSQSPTLSAVATMQGVLLGTAAYMSPEQARGKTVDKRTDIWAFGCVLYELLTAKRAFRGETIQDTIAAVLEREPDWQALPASTPTRAHDLLRRCLQKDSQRRLHDIADARIEIEEALTAPAKTGATTPTVMRDAGWRRVVPWSVAGVIGIVALLLAGLTISNLKPSPSTAPGKVSRFTITLPRGQQLLASVGVDSAVAISPDGTSLAYVAFEGGTQKLGTQKLYLRAMDSLESKPIPDTEGANSPFFSPDGKWLGFFADGKLKKVPLGGGPSVSLADAGIVGVGGDWGSHGMIAFTSQATSDILQVPDAGGTHVQPLIRIEKTDERDNWPEFLAGGKAVLFSVGGAALDRNNSQIAVQSLATGERRNLVQGGTYPRYVPTGHLIYAQRGTLMAVPFDLKRLEVTGVAAPIVESVLTTAWGAAQYSISATGSLVYITGGAQAAGQSRLVWINRNGHSEQPLAAPAHAYRGPQVSPDGKTVAVGIQEQEAQVWLYDLAREALTRLTFAGNYNVNPVWTPDGKRIAFTSNNGGPHNVFWQLADGSGQPERLTSSEYVDVPTSWSPDGQVLAFFESHPSTGWDIWMLSLKDSKLQPFLQTRFNEGVARFSPDGHWLAYISNESGRDEIYVQPYPGPGGKWQVSTEGGNEPVWNRNGRELFYRSGNKMMDVDVTTQPSFSVGKPKMLFEGQYVPSPLSFPNYDVSPDGQRFLMLKGGEQEATTPTQINVVLNWFEELKRRVPTGK